MKLKFFRKGSALKFHLDLDGVPSRSGRLLFKPGDILVISELPEPDEDGYTQAFLDSGSKEYDGTIFLLPKDSFKVVE